MAVRLPAATVRLRLSSTRVSAKDFEIEEFQHLQACDFFRLDIKNAGQRQRKQIISIARRGDIIYLAG
jgi:hypothetical protein